MTKRSTTTATEDLPPSRVGRPPESRNVRVARIVAAGADLFLTHGFDAVTMELIARAGGVSKATLYAHFESKESLFAVVMAEEAQKLNHGIWDGVDESDEIANVLSRIGLNYCAFFVKKRTLMLQRSAIGAIARFPEIGQHIYLTGPMQLREQLRAFLGRAVVAGSLNIEHPMIAVDHFLNLVRGDADLRGLLGLELPAQSEIDLRVEMAVKVFLRYYGPFNAA